MNIVIVIIIEIAPNSIVKIDFRIFIIGLDIYITNKV